MEDLKVIERGLVYIAKDEAICNSLQVAEKFGKRHDNVVRDIDNLLKNEETLKMFTLSSYTEKQNKQVYRMYIMNRDGFSLLAMGFTGKKALEWKLKYINAFNEIERQLRERQSAHWQQTRIECKSNRKLETDEIKAFIEYAKKQGSQNAKRYYVNLTKLANNAIGVSPNGRDEITINQLNNLILIEHIIEQVIREGIKKERYYKDIFIDCKKRVEQFREISFLTSK